MSAPRRIAVIDIGKTNAKLALVDLATLAEIAVLTRPNIVRPGPPWPHFDVAGHWDFLLAGLAQFHLGHGIDAISITTHGASAALLDARGRLAAPIMDYEHPLPAEIEAAYDRIRPPFVDTGSPRLAGGLNLGAQLFAQFQIDPDLHARTRVILPYPQYWGHRLTGIAASDVTSIGCHTDLWLPGSAQFSPLVDTLGIADKIAPVRRSGEVLGTLLPQVAAATGLPASTPVAVGIHDSNASLYPHLLSQTELFSVVSTGTWVVAMSMGGGIPALDPDRDTLVNVNAQGRPVPSARFMGGREYEVLLSGRDVPVGAADLDAVLRDGIMILPAVAPSTGPYQGRKMRWTGEEPEGGSGRRAAAVAFYLAMMTDTCLRLTAADGPVIVEGPFARNAAYLAMLGAATGRSVKVAGSDTGTSIGAALLLGSSEALVPARAVAPPRGSRMHDHASRWRDAVAGR